MQMKKLKKLAVLLAIVVGLLLLSRPVLVGLGKFLVTGDEHPAPAEAAVVLATGVDYTERLIEAAHLYEKGLVKKIVIDGDRKSQALKDLEKEGYVEPCRWEVNYLAVLKFLGVNEQDVVVIDAPDAFDTVSEAKFVGASLQKQRLNRLIITTSKFHTRRAAYIWRNAFPGQFDIQVAGAGNDQFDPQGWWKEGRQVRQLLGEYGGWFQYWTGKLRSS